MTKKQGENGEFWYADQWGGDTTGPYDSVADLLEAADEDAKEEQLIILKKIGTAEPASKYRFDPLDD